MPTAFDWSTTPAENTSVGGVNIAEGCPAPNLNDAIRQVMAAVRATFNADVRLTSNLEVGTSGIPGSGRLKVIPASDGYTVSTYGLEDYNALQFTRSVSGSVSEIGTIRVTNQNLQVRSNSELHFHSGGVLAARFGVDQAFNIGAFDITGSGKLRVSETASGGHCITTRGSATYTAVQFVNVNTQVGTITCDGSQTYYNTTSDARLKDEIDDAGAFGQLIDALQVRSFKWKASGAFQRAGFIAQELRQIIPEAVSTPSDPDQMMSVDYSKLVPFLVAEVQSLRARVSEMEAR